MYIFNKNLQYEIQRKNPAIANRIVSRGLTDPDMTKLIVVFSNFANVPKNEHMFLRVIDGLRWS